MDPSRSGSNSRRREWHARIEHYTPDGALGRFLLGAPIGMTGLWLLALALFEIPRWGISLAALFWAPVLLGVSIPALLFSGLLLWPIYLSLIGNIDSTASYAASILGESKGVPDAAPAGDGATERTGPANGTTPASRGPSTPNSNRAPPADPLERLKQQYAAGAISEDEFERRLEAHLEGDGDETGSETAERLSERE